MDKEKMQPFIEFFSEFLNTEEAQKFIRMYYRGHITFSDVVKDLEQVREDSKHFYIVRCKEEKKGARWRDYSGPNLSRTKAELFACELNHGEYGEHISANGNRIIFKAFQTA